MLRLILRRVTAIFGKTGKISKATDFIKTKVGGIFEIVFGATSFFVKIMFVFQTLVGLISLIFSAILLLKNFDTVKDLVSGVSDGSDKWLDKLVKVFSQYPDFNTLLAQMDSSMSSASSHYFSPPVTFTSILNTFGIGEAFNTIVSTAIQGIAFIISIRLLMWSLSRVKLTITRPLG